MRSQSIAVLTAVCLLGVTTGLRAEVIRNAGFNVLSGNSGLQAGSGTLAAGVYGGATIANDHLGRMLNPGFESHALVFDAAAVFGPGSNPSTTISSATLFLDLRPTGHGHQDFGFSVDVNGGLVGIFTQDDANFSGVPNPHGSLGYTATSDNSNMIINLTGTLLSDLQTNSAYTITLTWLSGNPFSFDGANIQAQLHGLEMAQARPIATHHPEPASLLTWSLLLTAGAACMRRRKRM